MTLASRWPRGGSGPWPSSLLYVTDMVRYGNNVKLDNAVESSLSCCLARSNGRASRRHTKRRDLRFMVDRSHQEDESTWEARGDDAVSPWEINGKAQADDGRTRAASR